MQVKLAGPCADSGEGSLKEHQQALHSLLRARFVNGLPHSIRGDASASLSNSMESIELFPASMEDEAFAFRVTEAAMRGYVEQTWGRWNADEQRANHSTSFKPDTHQIVRVGEQAAGILAVVEHPSHVQLEKLYLLPEFRNQGVGAYLLALVLAHAKSSGKPLRLRVLAVNKSAQRFYIRHGLQVTETTLERVFMASDGEPVSPQNKGV